MIACLGGELPTEFLKSIGVVASARHHGDKAMPNPALGVNVQPTRQQRSRATTLVILGAGVLLACWPRWARLLPAAAGPAIRAAEHALLKPSGAWGHGVGMLATVFMLLNFVYAMRKRVQRFKRKGPIGPGCGFTSSSG